MQIFDIPISILSVVTGAIFLAFRRRFCATLPQRVSAGELTEADAKKQSRLFAQVGWTSLFLGVGIAASHFLSK
jgi:hypothetical protein